MNETIKALNDMGLTVKIKKVRKDPLTMSDAVLKGIALNPLNREETRKQALDILSQRYPAKPETTQEPTPEPAEANS